MPITQILQQYYGYQKFRPMQEEIISAVLDGKDVLALLPTGGGKSVCFQVPALASDGICLVISPLVALMKDQVQGLRKKGIPSLSIYSGMGFREVLKTLQNAAYGNYKFLYVSPERLETSLFLEFLPLMKISLVAVDEAHCISQWGYDFRPSYCRIAALRELLPGVPMLALTASATAIVQDDICDKLKFGAGHQRFQQSFERPNLSYSVFNVASRQNKLLEILNKVNGSAIVYCKSRKHTQDVAALLRMNKISADLYHAGLTNEDRNTRQENWIAGITRVVVCTNAFGMGIDKPDVRAVIHYGVPDCLENYYQEAGRAGRDGQKAYAVLLYNDRELAELELLPGIRYPDRETIKTVYTALMNHLQVAAGSGEGCSFDFDLAAFCSAFKLNILIVTYAIKTLEQEEIIRLSESMFNPSTLVFQAYKDQLEAFEHQFPKYEAILKGLLRSYEGILDYPAMIREAELARFLGKDLAEVKLELRQLHQYGIVEYMPQKEHPQLSLLLNRMYSDSFLLDLQNYLLRKENFVARIKAMTACVRDTSRCRSQLIAAYFNDPHVKNCGICDNCLHRKSLKINPAEFERIANHIAGMAAKKPVGIKEILHEGKYPKEKLWKVIDYLQAEKKLVTDEDGIISINLG